MIEGFSSFFYSYYVLLPFNDPQFMKPADGLDDILLTFQQPYCIVDLVEL